MNRGIQAGIYYNGSMTTIEYHSGVSMTVQCILVEMWHLLEMYQWFLPTKVDDPREWESSLFFKRIIKINSSLSLAWSEMNRYNICAYAEI